jgi:hypothetical protein
LVSKNRVVLPHIRPGKGIPAVLYLQSPYLKTVLTSLSQMLYKTSDSVVNNYRTCGRNAGKGTKIKAKMSRGANQDAQTFVFQDTARGGRRIRFGRIRRFAGCGAGYWQ